VGISPPELVFGELDEHGKRGCGCTLTPVLGHGSYTTDKFKKTRNFCPWEVRTAVRKIEMELYMIYIRQLIGRMVECRVKMNEHMHVEFVYYLFPPGKCSPGVNSAMFPPPESSIIILVEWEARWTRTRMRARVYFTTSTLGRGETNSFQRYWIRGMISMICFRIKSKFDAGRKLKC
jgi:hypothetical protein